MLWGSGARLRTGLSWAARKLAGAICLAVAAVFLTLAAWVALSSAYGVPVAALCVGAVYLLAGVVLMALPGRRRPAAAPPVAAGTLVEAFLAGRAAGQAMGRDCGRR